MVVVDANLLVALVSGDPRGNKVLQHFTDWLSHDVEIHAPFLAQYETANALKQLIQPERRLNGFHYSSSVVY